MYLHVLINYGVKSRRNKACKSLYLCIEQMAIDKDLVTVDSPVIAFKTEIACTAIEATAEVAVGSAISLNCHATGY